MNAESGTPTDTRAKSVAFFCSVQPQMAVTAGLGELDFTPRRFAARRMRSAK
jgi:hypothetical protein